MMAEAKWLILFGVASYGFGALSVTADELYGIAQFCGTRSVYYFPIIGARGCGMSGSTFSLDLELAISVLVLQRTKPARREGSDQKQS